MHKKRSWILVALILTVLTLMIVQLTAGGRVRSLFTKLRITKRTIKSGPQLYPIDKKDKFSTEKLNDLLGYSIPRGASQVVALLALAMDKDKPKTILGRFSVNELLDLNNYHSKDCTRNGLVEHRKKCSKLDPSQIPPPDHSGRLALVRSEQYQPVTPSDKPLDYLKYYNLHKYCIKTLNRFEEQCHRDEFALAVAKVKIDKNNLDKLRKTVDTHIEANEIEFQYDYRTVVKRFLAKLNLPEVQQIKSDCTKMVRKLGQFFQDAKYRASENEMSQHYKICEAVVN